MILLNRYRTHGLWSRALLRPLLSIAAVVALAACDPGIETETGGDTGNDGGGDGDDPPPTTDTFVGVSPFWQLALEDDEFELDLRARPGAPVDTTATGDFTTLDSGFSRFVVNFGQGSSAPAQNTQLEALAIDEDLLFARSWQGNQEIVPLIPGPECRTTSFRANWIQWTTPTGDLATNPQEGFFGVLSYSPTSEDMFIEESYALTEGFPETVVEDDPFIEGSCEDGVIEDNGNRLLLGARGTAIVQTDAETGDEATWLALPRDSLTSAVLDGEYIGFWTDLSRAGAARTWYLTLSCTDGSCPAQRISDIASLNSITNEVFEISLNVDEPDQPTTGFVTGRVISRVTAVEAYAGNIVCAATENFNGTGIKVLACVGQSPTNNAVLVKGIFMAEE